MTNNSQTRTLIGKISHCYSCHQVLAIYTYSQHNQKSDISLAAYDTSSHNVYLLLNSTHGHCYFTAGILISLKVNPKKYCYDVIHAYVDEKLW